MHSHLTKILRHYTLRSACQRVTLDNLTLVNRKWSKVRLFHTPTRPLLADSSWLDVKLPDMERVERKPPARNRETSGGDPGEDPGPRERYRPANSGPGLADTVTPELEEEILAGNASLRFALRKVISELKTLQTRKKNALPLPQSLSVEEWRNLISLTDYRSRVHYLDMLNGTGEMSYQGILELDEMLCNPLQISEEMIQEAVGDDTESRRRIKIFLMHHEMMRQEGEVVPFKVTVKDLTEIANITSTSGYKRFIAFLVSKEFLKLGQMMRRRAIAKKSVEKVRERQEIIANEDHIFYGLGQNAIFIRTSDSRMDAYYNWKAVREFNDWGQPLVIDMSYFSQIKNRQAAKSLVYRELVNSVTINKTSKTPFQLHITGVGDQARELMGNQLPHNDQLDSCYNATSEVHLDMFPRERLVYLSPDSKNDLKRFDPNDIYVIGGIIDKATDRQPLTLSTARRLKVRHARFPMRQTIGFVADLNVDTCVAILHDLKETQNWFYSLRWVPPRYFASRIRSGSQDVQHQLTYRAHKQLSPTTGKGEEEAIRNRNLDPVTYRRLFTKIMKAKSREEVEELMEEIKR